MATLAVTNGFGPTSERGELDLIDWSITESLDNNDVLQATILWPPRTAVVQRSTVRHVDDDGRITEWRLNGLLVDEGGTWATLTGGPPLQDLSTSGLIRKIVAGVAETSFSVSAPLSTVLQTYVLEDLPAPLNVWLDTTLGTLDDDPIIEAEWEQWTRLQLMRGAQGSRFEIALERQSSGLYRIAYYLVRGDTAPRTRVARGLNLLRRADQSDDQDVASVVLPFGDAPSEDAGPATIADNVWKVTAMPTGGWITLVDSDGVSAGPVAFDDQFVGNAIGWPNGSTMTYRTIIDARVSDGSVQLADTAGIVVGQLVALFADVTGQPLIEVSNPDLLASDVGRVEVSVAVSGGRGERNFVENPQMAGGTLGYVEGDLGVLVDRSKFPATLAPLANGSRAAALATTTPFAIDGLAANTPIYEGSRIDVEGKTMFVTTDAIPGTDGSITLVFNTGLPGALPDNAPLTIVRQRRRAFTVAGTQNLLGRGVLVTGADDQWGPQHVLKYDPNGRGDLLRYSGLTANPGPYYGGTLIAASDGSGNRRIYQVASFGGYSMPGWGPLAGGTLNAVITGTNYNTTIGGLFAPILTVSAAQSAIVAAMTVNVTYINLTGWAFVLDSKVTNGDGSFTLTFRFDTAQLLPGEVGPTASYQIGGFYSNYTYQWSNAQYSNGTTLEVWQTFETRTLYTNGAYAAGATTIAFKPSTDIARRDFITGDSISLASTRTITMRVTALTSWLYEDTDPESGHYTSVWNHELTLDLANSNIDELATGDWAWQEFAFKSAGIGRLIRINEGSLHATNKLYVSCRNEEPGLDNDILSVVPRTLTAQVYSVDVYSLTSGSSWGTNGRITANISIPSGRSYAAGQAVTGPGMGGTTDKMATVSAVTGPASSIVIEGWDDLRYVGHLDANGSARGDRNAIYRVKGDSNYDHQSNILIQGDVLYVAATAVANGSGQASVTLKAPNTIFIADNLVLRIVQRSMAYAGENATGNALRLLGSGWEPAGGDPWAKGPLCYVPFYPGMTSRQLTASVWFVVNFDNGNQPLASPLQVAILSQFGTPLGTASVAQVYGTGVPQLIRITTQVTITAAGFYRIGVSGGAYLNNELFAAVRLLLSAGPATDVPYIEGSWANRLLREGNAQLVARARDRRSINVTLAEFEQITGTTPSAAALTPGASFVFEDEGETVRLFSVTRVGRSRSLLRMTLESLQRTASRLLGAGASAAVTGSGTSAVSGGSGGGGGTTTVVDATGVTIVDATGSAVSDVRTVDLVGLSVAANGTRRAVVVVTPVPDVTSADIVLNGGDWVVRDLAALSYVITIQGGTGTLAGQTIRWNTTAVTCPAANGFVSVNASGVVVARVANAPETLPPTDELLLYRTYVDIGIYGQRIYAVADSRTWGRLTPRAPLFLRERVEASKITSGAWAGATALNEIGDINWYFANLALYPFVEELPTQVKDHLDVQIAKFWGSAGPGSADWNTLHGTTWASNFIRYPYDVGDPRGTPTKKRADSHDAYAGTFLRLAVRYAKLASGGLAWWDANYADIKECFYRNIVQSQRLVNGGAGYMCETFQDPTVYPFCQTLDNIEAYRGLQDAFDLMTSRGGTQATDAAYYASTATNMLSGVRSQWRTTANANGETEWISIAWDNAGAVGLVNNHQRWYPDLTMGVPAILYGVDLHGTPSIARERLAKLFERLNAKAPGWYQSRRYDLYPWGIVAAAAVKIGYRDIGEAWLSFVQRHVANDSPGYFIIQDIGWARYIERLLAGEVL